MRASAVDRSTVDNPAAWLTTVTPGGAPLPSPVWFWWDGADTVYVFSLPDTARTRNIEANGKVSLNFAGDGWGGDIVIVSGVASLEGQLRSVMSNVFAMSRRRTPGSWAMHTRTRAWLVRKLHSAMSAIA